jgi:hypothetical protein
MLTPRIHPIVRLGALLLLIGAWAGFFVLLVFGLARVRQFPGFQNFMVFVPSSEQIVVAASTAAAPTAVIVRTPEAIQEVSPQSVRGGSARGGSSNPRPATAVPTAAPRVAAVPPRAPSYPTRCQHSVETRLYVGASGYTSYDPLVRLRLSPGANDGTRLAGGTQFTITGEPRCADLWHPWNNYLWWPVRLTSGTLSGSTGWLPESMITEGRVVMLLFPN